ncbi:MAG TPA: WbqC family protein [Fibrobacteria bacterium]|nr:WbqC family protein [Fibrobacteria bacterium]
MILTAHQPSYLPWLGLFHKIALADRFVVFDQVQYVPKDWISRNTIKGPNGPILLTVPVLRKDHREKRIIDIEIHNGTPWAKKHWMSIEQCYRKAPFFKAYADFFEETYKREWALLADLDYHMLIWFLETLGIKTPVNKAGEFEFEGTKSDLVLDMCRKLGAGTYIFGALGAGYADVGTFRAAGVIPYFQNYVHPEYRQGHGPFLPNMSVVDLLFNVGPASLETIMSCNATRDEVKMLK